MILVLTWASSLSPNGEATAVEVENVAFAEAGMEVETEDETRRLLEEDVGLANDVDVGTSVDADRERD